MIGAGSYGKVYLVQHKENRRFFAMKVIKKELVFQTNSDEGVKGKQTRLLWSHLTCDFLVQLREIS